MFHVTGLNGQLLPILAAGGSIVLLPRFDARRLAALFADASATFFHAAPTVYTLALRAASRQAKTLRVCVCGGAAVSRRTIEEVRAFAPGVDFRISYGLTETSSPGVLTPGDGWLDRRPAAAGVAVPADEVSVDCSGELLFRGATVIAGYDGDPEATAAAFAGDWLRTGDIGTIDDDGFVTLLDRIKDQVNRGSEKVASLEVERALAEHPAVVECAVVPRAHEVYGEVPHAVVVLREPGATTAEELRAFAAERLARFKVPASVQFTAELPRNPGGKVLKHLLR
jgi:long-chain acyl-CoA synthetase